MGLQSARTTTLSQRPEGWLRLASRALFGRARRAPSSGKPAPAASPYPRQPVVGVKKSAVCKDARGQLRTIELFLPADLVRELARPLDIRFLDGEKPVTAGELGKAIRSNFINVGAESI